MRRLLIAAICAGLVTLVGCEAPKPVPERLPGTADAGDATDASVDVLRSLPYAAAATEPPTPESSGVVANAGEAWPGHSLYVSRNPPLAALIDLEGRELRRWQDPRASYWVRAELVPGNDVLVIGAHSGPADADSDDADRYLARLAWDGRELWRRDGPYHHDVEMTPAGRILTLGFRYVRSPDIDPTHEIRDDELLLLDEGGELLESRSLLAALTSNPAEFALQPVKPTRRHGRAHVDLIHANTVQWMPHPHLAGRHPLYAPGNVLVTSRHQDAAFVIEWATGRLVWAWGQGELSGPHDAQVLESGNILVFDNGLEPKRSRILEIDPLTKRIVWQYQADPPRSFFSRARGTCQRLPNGNTLVADSDNGRAFEVTPAGAIVWEFKSPHAEPASGGRSIIGRIKRFPVERFAMGGS